MNNTQKVIIGGAAAVILLRLLDDAASKDYWPLMEKYSAKYNIDAFLVKALARKESGFRTDAVNHNTNGTNDYGLMQVNETTFKHYGIESNFLDSDINIETASKLIADNRRELGDSFSIYTWISAYNVGTPHVLKYGITNPAYVGEVFLYYNAYKLY